MNCLYCAGDHNEERCASWSEREAVVAYLLDRAKEFGPLTGAARSALEFFADLIARGDHLTAARDGRLDAFRERVRGMVK